MLSLALALSGVALACGLEPDTTERYTLESVNGVPVPYEQNFTYTLPNGGSTGGRNTLLAVRSGTLQLNEDSTFNATINGHESTPDPFGGNGINQDFTRNAIGPYSVTGTVITMDFTAKVDGHPRHYVGSISDEAVLVPWADTARDGSSGAVLYTYVWTLRFRKNQ